MEKKLSRNLKVIKENYLWLENGSRSNEASFHAYRKGFSLDERNCKLYWYVLTFTAPILNQSL